MATIKVKRNSNSRGKCKLAFNKVYTARVNPTYNRSYIIGNNVYLSEYFTIVTDQQPKPKPIVKTDPETGKLKVERDWSKPVAFPEKYEIPKGVRVVKVGEDDRWVRKGSVGVTISNSSCPFVKWENENYNLNNIDGHWNQPSFKLAPLNPTDHPEHTDFGKSKPHPYLEYDHSVEFKFKEFDPESKLTPEPFDMREVIAGYIRQHGTQLTAIELIGHLTIDAKWQSTEK